MRSPERFLLRPRLELAFYRVTTMNMSRWYCPSKTHFRRCFQAALVFLVGLATAEAEARSGSPQNVTIQSLNKQLNRYLGKQISLRGRVDQVLGNGGYIVEDQSFRKGEESLHRILIYVPALSTDHTNSHKPGQQAGRLALELKEGDHVQLRGKVERLKTNNEVDAFSPKEVKTTLPKLR